MKNPDNQAVHAIDRLFYLIFTRIFTFIFLALCVLAALYYYIVQGVDCTASCVGANLSGRNLRNAILNDTKLTEADLQFSDLSGAKLQGADLSGASLIGVNLRNADLRQAILIGADLTGADLRNALLDDTDFRGADLTRIDLTRANLTTAKLDGVTLVDAKLVEVNLEGATLAGVSFTGANFTGANLNKANLNGTGLSEANLSGISFIDGQLSGSWANLANFTGANMTGASLAGTQFVGANLTSANLTNATLVGSVFIGSRLNGSIISGANLTGAKLFLAELPPSVFNAAQSDPTLLSLNELQKSAIIQNVDLGGITFNSSTIWPVGKNTLLAGILGPRFNANANPAAQATQPETMTIEALKTIDMGRIQLPPVNPAQIKGDIMINGSTAVYPLTNLMAQSFKQQGFEGNIKVGSLGTTQGVKQFCEPTETNKVDIVSTSRLMTEEELALCKKNGLNPVRLMLGYETIAIVTNPTNEEVNNITSEQLPLLFNALNWSNIDPNWPGAPILRFTGGPENSIYDFLINKLLDGNEDTIINAPNIEFGTETHTVLGVASNENAIGFVGYAYYQQNIETMKLLSINDIYPSTDSVANKTYPLIRPFYLYTDPSILGQKPQIAAFLNFYLTYINVTTEGVGYFPLMPAELDQQEYAFLTLLNFRHNY